MIRSAIVLFLLFHLLLPLAVQADTDARLLVLGDSLSSAYGIPLQKGWVSLLQKRLQNKHMKWQLINASITGDTTHGGLARLPELLQRHRPAIVIIELGGNDGLRGLSLREMQRNLVKMTQLAQQAGAAVLLLGVRLPANYGPVYGERFHRVYREVADTTGATLVDFFLQGVAETTERMQADGIHPAAEAQPLILDNIWPELEPQLVGKTLQQAPAGTN